MPVQTINELLTAVLGYFFVFVFGAVISFVVTKREMKGDATVRLLTVSVALEKAVGRISRFDGVVTKQDEILEELKSLQHLRDPERGNLYSDVFLANNPQLFARLNQDSLEKRATGKYLESFISNNPVWVVDCGTTSAWAFYEIVKSKHENLKVLTNNIFVASQISEEYGYTEKADTWGVQEVASGCRVLSGQYFPSYGGILDERENSEELYLAELENFKPNILLLGCTSFKAREGPYARSGANRRFKRSMLSYVASHKNVSLFILLSAKKIGIQIGEPCSNELWEQISNRKNVHIVCGTRDVRNEIEQIDPVQKAIINEEIRIMNDKGVKYVANMVDLSGTIFDLRKNGIKRID